MDARFCQWPSQIVLLFGVTEFYVVASGGDGDRDRDHGSVHGHESARERCQQTRLGRLNDRRLLPPKTFGSRSAEAYRRPVRHQSRPQKGRRGFGPSGRSIQAARFRAAVY